MSTSVLDKYVENVMQMYTILCHIGYLNWIHIHSVNISKTKEFKF